VKAGMKNSKLEELERLKAMYELKDCTFKPKVKASSSKGRDKSQTKKEEIKETGQEDPEEQLGD